MLVRIAKEVGTVALGATVGEDLVRRLVKKLADTAYVEGPIGLSYEGVEATNASFVKATLLWLHTCGRLYAGQKGMYFGESLNAPRPLDIYPYAFRPSLEVLAEINEVFESRKLPIVVAEGPIEDPLAQGNIKGMLAKQLEETWELALLSGETSPAALRRDAGKGASSGTVWNNRLKELNALRLLIGSRKGRDMIYKPLIRRKSNG